MIYDLWLRVQGLGFGARVWEFGVQGLRFGVEGLMFMVWDLGCRVYGSG